MPKSSLGTSSEEINQSMAADSCLRLSDTIIYTGGNKALLCILPVHSPGCMCTEHLQVHAANVSVSVARNCS